MNDSGQKKVWSVDLKIIEEHYHGRHRTRIGIAETCVKAVASATKEEKQGNKHQLVEAMSAKFLGELSF